MSEVQVVAGAASTAQTTALQACDSIEAIHQNHLPLIRQELAELQAGLDEACADREAEYMMAEALIAVKAEGEELGRRLQTVQANARSEVEALRLGALPALAGQAQELQAKVERALAPRESEIALERSVGVLRGELDGLPARVEEAKSVAGAAAVGDTASVEALRQELRSKVEAMRQQVGGWITVLSGSGRAALGWWRRRGCIENPLFCQPRFRGLFLCEPRGPHPRQNMPA